MKIFQTLKLPFRQFSDLLGHVHAYSIHNSKENVTVSLWGECKKVVHCVTFWCYTKCVTQWEFKSLVKEKIIWLTVEVCIQIVRLANI